MLASLLTGTTVTGIVMSCNQKPPTLDYLVFYAKQN